MLELKEMPWVTLDGKEAILNHDGELVWETKEPASLNLDYVAES